MTVTKSRNLIANRNTGGNKKQGLVSSVGKSNKNRQAQLTRSCANDKTVYCINQFGGIGRNRNQTSYSDSTACVKSSYTINSALNDVIRKINNISFTSPSPFHFIAISNNQNITNMFIYNNISSKISSNYFNISFKNNSDISGNIHLTPGKIIHIKNFNNRLNDISDNNLFYFSRSDESYLDISDSDSALLANGFLPSESDDDPYPVSVINPVKYEGISIDYVPYLFGSLKIFNKFYNKYYIQLPSNFSSVVYSYQ